MPRCIYCDYCDTAGSVSTPREHLNNRGWWETAEGYICGDCAEQEEDEFLDHDEDEED